MRETLTGTLNGTLCDTPQDQRAADMRTARWPCMLDHGGVPQRRIAPGGAAKPVAVERARAAFDAIRRVLVERGGLFGRHAG